MARRQHKWRSFRLVRYTEALPHNLFARGSVSDAREAPSFPRRAPSFPRARRGRPHRYIHPDKNQHEPADRQAMFEEAMKKLNSEYEKLRPAAPSPVPPVSEVDPVKA